MKTTKAKRNSSAPAVMPPAKPQILLLAVTGMTPAVLTETIWALAYENPPVIPDRVVAVTTAKGKELMESELFSLVGDSNENLWQTLRREILGANYQDDGRLNHEYEVISAPNARTGRREPLEDFRTSADNAAMADFVLEKVRSFVETPDIHLITSIAGGRKTLGALLYACMSLMGRETDRLTHVLVNEPFDSLGLSPRFYFPKQPIQSLKTAGGKIFMAHDAQIDLGDIPFVALRNLIDRDLIRTAYSFTDLVKRCRRKVNEVASRNVSLVIWRSRREMSVNDIKVQNSPSQQVLMLFLADPAMNAVRAQITKFSSAIEPLRKFANHLYCQRKSNELSDWRFLAQLASGFDDESLRKQLNELKGKLRAAGTEASLLVPCLPTKGRFSLDLPPTAITVRD